MPVERSEAKKRPVALTDEARTAIQRILSRVACAGPGNERLPAGDSDTPGDDLPADLRELASSWARLGEADRAVVTDLIRRLADLPRTVEGER